MNDAGLTREEFIEMIQLLQRHIEFDMDQWELWRIDGTGGTAYIDISRKAAGPDDAYTNLTPCISQRKKL